MKITPIDIAHKTFTKKIMGWDSQEVSEFMQQISAQLEALIYERNHLKEVLREKELTLLEYKEKDKMLKETISAASQMSEKLKVDAEREAKLIITDAQQKAEMLLRDSKESLRKSYQDITDLKRARLQFEANLKALVQAHMSILEQGEKFLPSVHYTNQEKPQSL
ncbi:MAG: DivIVA domain-containing protein [Bdellovibrionaceae bacterium]|nr:DivIVA domain-containing protein [Pseudobdellovibrionaceae bacterium]